MQTLNITKTAFDSGPFGAINDAETDVLSVPQGRCRGLYGALARTVRVIDEVRALPEVLVIAGGGRESMFDYDPAQAVSLDIPFG